MVWVNIADLAMFIAELKNVSSTNKAADSSRCGWGSAGERFVRLRSTMDLTCKQEDWRSVFVFEDTVDEPRVFTFCLCS